MRQAVPDPLQALLADQAGGLDLVFEIALEAEDQAGHQGGGAQQQCAGDADDCSPVGAACWVEFFASGVELGIPFFNAAQAVNNGVQSAARNREPQQGDQQPTERVVLAQLLHTLQPIKTQCSWNGEQPSQRV